MHAGVVGRLGRALLLPGRALLALMDQTIAGQGSPAHSMPILRQVVSRSTTLTGVRGESAAAAAEILARLEGAKAAPIA